MHYMLILTCMNNDDLGVELFSDASCDSVDPIFGGNQKPNNKILKCTQEKEEKGFMCKMIKIMNL